MHHLLAACKKDLLDIYQHAVDAVKPEKLVRQCVTFSARKLTVSDPLDNELKPISYDLNGHRIHVIGGGKCVLGMAKGIAQLAHESNNAHLLSHGCLSLPVYLAQSFDSDTGDLLKSANISWKFGSKNNLPDEDSVDATKNILNCVDEATRRDKSDGLRSLFIVLLSGGGSSCLTSPKFITLDVKLKIIKKLVQAGASIEELNTFRRSFSGVKGGELARYILTRNPNSKILSLIISDVVGDPLDFIASGPTCVSDQLVDNRQSMEEILEKYSVRVPSIDEKPDRCNIEPDLIRNVIVGNNKLALGALMGRARELGYEATCLGDNFTGYTHQVLKRLLDHAQNHEPTCAKSLIVCGGESTVLREPGETWGVGGRTQEMALDYMIAGLTGASSRSTSLVDLFFAGSTDGQDGPTDVAGCLASLAEHSETKAFSLGDVKLAKASHNSNSFWLSNKPDWLVRLGPTGTNVMDFYLLMRIRKGSTA